ncbi:hypothetical protein FDT80_04550 [Sulfitobacter sabulilitoris]|uniref:Uncharacterized protein n=1 Tax=Sulfitobacter sabulilitoris TaxID=2562655 RepID=A0A5S3PQN0_9RHOB|nr:hypothetical protein FDT80_04550 [Sulfitobacter sabulilitoris]
MSLLKERCAIATVSGILPIDWPIAANGSHVAGVYGIMSARFRRRSAEFGLLTPRMTNIN